MKRKDSQVNSRWEVCTCLWKTEGDETKYGQMSQAEEAPRTYPGWSGAWKRVYPPRRRGWERETRHPLEVWWESIAPRGALDTQPTTPSTDVRQSINQSIIKPRPLFSSGREQILWRKLKLFYEGCYLRLHVSLLGYLKNLGPES